MSEQTATTRFIDGLQFAHSGQILSGSFAIKQLPRLLDIAASDNGNVSYHISGKRDQQGKPWLECVVEGTVELQCQRCMQSFVHPFSVKSALMLVASEAALPDPEAEPDEMDAIVATPEMNVADMVEEEILLSLPMIPRHEACEIAEQGKVTTGNSGFAGLAALKKSRNS
jgi:uncharacterized protein